jgi:DNA-binding transcriptional LysR family regulator
VQAFVLAVDLKSFTRAAEVMNTTQSAVSLKIKRLEDGLGKRLLERTPRLVRLSAEGNAFLGPARALVAAHQGALGSFGVAQRRLIVGISHHIVGAELPGLLKRMISAAPELVMEMRVASSQQVFEEFDGGALDAAVVLRRNNWRRAGEVVLKEEFGWMAAPDFEYPAGGKLPLATQAEPCGVRNMAVTALDAAGILD